MDTLEDLAATLAATPGADPFRHTEAYLEACADACTGAPDPQPGELARLREENAKLRAALAEIARIGSPKRRKDGGATIDDAAAIARAALSS